MNREIVRKKRVGTYSQRNPFYGNHLLPGSKTGDPYLARFKRSAFLPRRRHFPRKRIPFSFALSRARKLLTLDYFGVETTSILLQLSWKKLKEGFTLEEWLPRPSFDSRDHFYVSRERSPSSSSDNYVQ